MFSYPPPGALPHKVEMCVALLVPLVLQSPSEKKALQPFVTDIFSTALRPGTWGQTWV